MSSHWGAVSGVALRLNNKDFNNMVETYLQKTYLPDATESDMEEFWDKIENDIGTISEFPFLRSKYRTESMKKLPTLDSCFQKTESELKDLFEHRILYRICCFDQYNTDIHEGGTFHPINNDTSFDVEDGDYFLYTIESTMPQDLLEHTTYSSTNDLIAEFKDAMEDYLPKTFNWNHNIGFFQTAIYG